MKTAISVDDELMREADRTATELGLSRSGLIAAALREYLDVRRRADITASLNRVYEKPIEASEQRFIRKMRSKVPIADRW